MGIHYIPRFTKGELIAAEQTTKDRALRKIAGLIVWASYRKVEVFRADTTTSDPGPLMSTSNHFGGFLDPLLMRIPVVGTCTFNWTASLVP